MFVTSGAGRACSGSGWCVFQLRAGEGEEYINMNHPRGKDSRFLHVSRAVFTGWIGLWLSWSLEAEVPATPSVAALEISGIFTDHMVLQRRMNVPVWGWARPGEEVTVIIDRQTKTTMTDDQGKWRVKLDAMETGAPRKMIIRGEADSIEFNDILVGEVWIASGQSNMDWPLSQARNGKQAIAAADLPEIRMFNLNRGGTPASKNGPSERILDGSRNSKKYKETWQICTPVSAKDNFSAVAFFFARDLQAALHVPIGIISNSVGGSAVEMWISRDAFEADPDFKAATQFFDRLVEYGQTPAGQADVKANYDAYEAKQAEAKAQGKLPLWPPHAGGAPKKDAFTCRWFDSRIHPLIPFAMRGVIWYQGEAQTYVPGDRQGLYPRDYEAMFQLLIKDWRTRWGEGDFPFLFVQLPNWSGPAKSPADVSSWTTIRQAQLKTLSVPNTAMAVTIDVGDAALMHPLDKEPVGARLALAARATVYGEKLEYSGPIYREMKIEGGAIRLFFDHIGGGLEARGGELKQFAIVGKDRKWVWAKAVIDGDTVIVSSPDVPAPTMARYAVATNPSGCNLYNKQGLPASPFMTYTSPSIERCAYYKWKLTEPLTLLPAKP